MKQKMTLTLTLTLMLTLVLTACGGGNGSSGTTSKDPNVDLQAFYTEVEEACDWGDGYMVDIEGEMLESYYPGLSEISTKQFVAKMPMMSAVVNEVVFLQCETEEDAAKAAELLQARIDMQAEGGAWYPESIAAWEKAQLLQNGTYVAMIASAEFQDEIADDFNALFT